MAADSLTPAGGSDWLTTSDRRWAVRQTFANALLWSVGNGLVSTTLVIYLALELGAKGIAISWILAAPRLAGVLRLGVPAMIARGERAKWGRKPICLASFIASGITLVAVPYAAIRTEAYGAGWGVSVLVAAWCVYHLLQYVATICLWSWIGDLYPASIRSRLLGQRERWLTIGAVIGTGASLALAVLWSKVLANAARWEPLAASAAIGTVLMLLALIPLARIPSLAFCPSAQPESPWRTLRQALAERPYRRLLAYSCWFGFANGITATAQGMYPRQVLGIDYRGLLSLRIGMRAGQAVIAPWCGRLIGRLGAKRLLLVAQLLVATGPLFFWFATPAPPWGAPWLVAGAFFVWIAYAGINVGLDTLKLGLADQQNNTPYLAVYHALSDLVNAATVLLGGFFYDTLSEGDTRALEVYATLFLLGWLCRTLAAGLILRLEE